MSLENDRIICEELTERQGPNFSIGFRTLPESKRFAIQASYAFCRIADDFADEDSIGPDAQLPHEALRAWRDELDLVYGANGGVAGARPTHPVSRALAESVRQFGIPRQCFEDLILGCEQDLDFEAPQRQSDLERYCDLVATSMGRICLTVFGYRDRRAEVWARALSQALQVTNILRDVVEDFERGRIYLPQNWIDDVGLAPDDLVSTAPRLGWYELMNRGIAFARIRYMQALPLIGAVDADSRLAVALMRGIYLEILEQIDRDPCRVLRERVELNADQRASMARKAQALVAGAFSAEA